MIEPVGVVKVTLMWVEKESDVDSVVYDAGCENVDPEGVQNRDNHPRYYSLSFKEKFVKRPIVEHATAIETEDDT